jgi:hypothetical protein
MTDVSDFIKLLPIEEARAASRTYKDRDPKNNSESNSWKCYLLSLSPNMFLVNNNNVAGLSAGDFLRILNVIKNSSTQMVRFANETRSQPENTLLDWLFDTMKLLLENGEHKDLLIECEGIIVDYQLSLILSCLNTSSSDSSKILTHFALLLDRIIERSPHNELAMSKVRQFIGINFECFLTHNPLLLRSCINLLYSTLLNKLKDISVPESFNMLQKMEMLIVDGQGHLLIGDTCKVDSSAGSIIGRSCKEYDGSFEVFSSPMVLLKSAVIGSPERFNEIMSLRLVFSSFTAFDWLEFAMMPLILSDHEEHLGSTLVLSSILGESVLSVEFKDKLSLEANKEDLVRIIRENIKKLGFNYFTLSMDEWDAIYIDIKSLSEFGVVYRPALCDVVDVCDKHESAVVPSLAEDVDDSMLLIDPKAFDLLFADAVASKKISEFKIHAISSKLMKFLDHNISAKSHDNEVIEYIKISMEMKAKTRNALMEAIKFQVKDLGIDHNLLFEVTKCIKRKGDAKYLMKWLDVTPFDLMTAASSEKVKGYYMEMLSDI